MQKLFYAGLLFLINANIAFSQTSLDRKLEEKLDSLISARYLATTPGCAILVAKNGKLVYKKAFGKANLELNVAMQSDMVFRIGSVTKQYTAIAILQLMEQGKLALTDSIQKFIKDFPYKGHTITIENLLTHTSGIIDYQALDTKEANENFYYRKDFEPKQVIDFFKNEPLVFTPGSKFSYSNSNYFLLGYIIETISGKSYKEYIQQNIFKVAGLSNTYYGAYKEIVPGRVTGYARYNGKYENADYVSMSIAYSAGALMSNVEDMFAWHQALYDYKLVKKETLAEATRPYRLSNDTLSQYGYGWFIKDKDGGKSIEHGGGIDGFQSDEMYLPEEDVFIAALYNSLNEDGNIMGFMDLTNDIATVAAGKAIEREVKVDVSILKQYVGVYAFDSAHMATISLEDGRLQMEAAAGGLPKSPLFAESETKFRLKVVDAVIEFVKDDSGKVIQLIAHTVNSNDVCKKIK